MKKNNFTRHILVLFGFFVVVTFTSTATSPVYAHHTCGDCPAGYTCPPTGHDCCEDHGCTCNCDNNQCNTNSGWDAECPGAYCCGGGNIMITVAGYVRDANTNVGIQNVNVSLYDTGTNTTIYDSTDSNGYFVFTNAVEAGYTYAVRVPGNMATPQTAPSGYIPPAQTTNNTASWNVVSGAHTPLNSASYESQEANASNDCGTDCNFRYQVFGNPVILSRSDVCVNPGNNLPYRTGTFNWTAVPGAVRYILRVNREDLTNPEWVSANDWWRYIPPSANTSTSGSCNGATCTATIGIQPAIMSFVPGQYLGWSVQAEAANGALSADVPGAAFFVNTCTPYSLSGTLNYVTVSGNTCTPVAGQSSLHSVANLTADPVTATFNVTTYSYSRSANVNAGNSNYTITNLPGAAGAVSLNRTVVSSNDPDLAAVGIQYRYQCIKAGNSGTWTYSPTLASIPVANFNTNLAGYNFGYVLENPYDDGWFASLDGDTYGEVIAANVSGVVAPNSGVEPYLTFHGGSREVAVFGEDIQVSPDRLVEGGKYIDGFTGGFWPSTFSFTPPAGATNLTNAQGLNTMQTGRVYRAEIGLVNSYLLNNDDYNLGGGAGVAVLYVTGSAGSLTFPQSFTSQHTDRRILIISQRPVYIAPDVGTTVATIGNLATSPAHLQIGLIAQHTITFGSSYSPNFPGQPDKIILLEGPFVAGSSDVTTVNIELRRNLGLSNALYPAALVKYNPIYGRELTENSGVMEQDVIWKVSP